MARASFSAEEWMRNDTPTSFGTQNRQIIPHAVSASLTRRSLFALTAAGIAARAGEAAAAPQGQLTYGVHVSLAPSWFDPGEAAGIITPYMLLYGLHDALVKAMPDNKDAPSLAESYTLSEDGLVHDFVLRPARFHNGDPVTSDDVKFSFERYRGASQSLLKQRVAAIDRPDPQHIRFRLKEPWPDFLTFYAGVSGAAWVVPRKYISQVGDDGFKKAPKIVHERAIYAPIWQLAFLNGIGPRVAESSLGRIPGFPYTAPFDELALKSP